MVTGDIFLGSFLRFFRSQGFGCIIVIPVNVMATDTCRHVVFEIGYGHCEADFTPRPLYVRCNLQDAHVTTATVTWYEALIHTYKSTYAYTYTYAILEVCRVLVPSFQALTLVLGLSSSSPPMKLSLEIAQCPRTS